MKPKKYKQLLHSFHGKYYFTHTINYFFAEHIQSIIVVHGMSLSSIDNSHTQQVIPKVQHHSPLKQTWCIENT